MLQMRPAAEVTRLFKSKLGLHKLALCVPWWDAAMMEAAAKHLGECNR